MVAESARSAPLGRARRAFQTGNRTYVDDSTELALSHVFRDGLCHSKGAEEVHIQHSHQLLAVHLQER
jgi:hypothetical protein